MQKPKRATSERARASKESALQHKLRERVTAADSGSGQSNASSPQIATTTTIARNGELKEAHEISKNKKIGSSDVATAKTKKK